MQWEDQPGWWVTDFEEDPVTGRPPSSPTPPSPGRLGGGAELYVLSVTFNSGEPADVDNILLLQKTGSWLGLIRAWNEGSACSGGIHTERMEGDNFLYARDLTPIDFLDLAVNVPLDLNAHEDLEATSESCFASANYVYSLTQDREDLVSVRLYDEPAGREGPDRAAPLPVLLQPDLQRLSRPGEDRAPAQGGRRVRGPVPGRMRPAGPAGPAPAPIIK